MCQALPKRLMYINSFSIQSIPTIYILFPMAGETEAHQSQVTCPSLHGWSSAELGFKARGSNSRVQPLTMI